MIFIYIFLFILSILVVIKSSDFSINLIEEIGVKIRIPTFFLSSVFLAIATSFPEFSIGIVSSLKNEGILSLGNILGANLMNLTLILGVSSFFSNGVKIKNKIIFKDLLATFLIAILPYFLILDEKFTRLEGGILIIVYLVYNIFLYKEENSEIQKEDKKGFAKSHRLLLELLFTIAVLAIGAQIVVFSSEKISQIVNFPIALIGIFFLSLGTTLPEMIVQLKSARQKQDDIFFGNSLGSVIVNSSLILGICGLISPFKISNPPHFFLTGIFTLISFALLPIFFRSKMKLEKKEGVYLFLLYLIFIIISLLLGKS